MRQLCVLTSKASHDAGVVSGALSGVSESEKVTIQTNETQYPWHGGLASRVCRGLLMTTVIECHHVTLARALEEDHVSSSAEVQRSSVGSGEVSTSGSGPFLPLISTPTSGHRLSCPRVTG